MPQMKPLASRAQSRRQSPRARSVEIAGHPRKALTGSKKRINDNQTIGANHAEGKTSGTIAPTKPSPANTIRVGFENLIGKDFSRLNAVAVNNSAVSHISGELVAKAQAYHTRV